METCSGRECWSGSFQYNFFQCSWGQVRLHLCQPIGPSYCSAKLAGQPPPDQCEEPRLLFIRPLLFVHGLHSSPEQHSTPGIPLASCGKLEFPWRHGAPRITKSSPIQVWTGPPYLAAEPAQGSRTNWHHAAACIMGWGHPHLPAAAPLCLPGASATACLRF